MINSNISPREIAQLLAQDAEFYAEELLPNGDKDGKHWVAGSVNGESGKSLKVIIEGPQAGYWKDFASGEGGDLIELWMLTKNLDFKDALIQIRERLNIENPRFEKVAQIKIELEPPRVDPENHVLHWLTKDRKLYSSIAKLNISIDGYVIRYPFYDNDGNLVMVKFRDMESEFSTGKKKIWTTKNPQKRLFGKNILSPGNRTIVFVEGENDAAACLEQGIEAVSTTFGGGDGNKQDWLDSEYDWLISNFDRFILMLDQDEEGNKAAQCIATRLGRHKSFFAKLPDGIKDANEAHIKGYDLKDCISRAQTVDPALLVDASDSFEAVIEYNDSIAFKNPGLNPPWQKAIDKIRILLGETTTLVAINGHGKTQLCGEWAINIINQGGKVLVASMEMTKEKLMWRMYRQMSGLSSYTREYAEAMRDWHKGKLFLFDAFGSSKKDQVLETFEYAYRRYGVKYFVLDSVSKCGIDEGDLAGQKNFVDTLADMARHLGIHILIVDHPRKQQDEMTPPNKMSVSGSGSKTNLSDNVWILWRNKIREQKLDEAERSGNPVDPELEAQPSALLYVHKQRHFEWEGTIGLYFDNSSFQFKENYGDRPKSWVKWSKEDGLKN